MSRTKISSPPKTASESFHEIATVRIELMGSDPLIWREVEVPTSITLKVLHDIIQIVMNWFDYHLWEFTIDERRYGLPIKDDWRKTPLIDATKVRLRDVLKSRKTLVDYRYDFGDSWEHRLTVTNIRPGKPGLSYPRYIAGELNAPPEDCGGIPGFYEMLDVVADPSHEGHNHLVTWLDGYDPKVIDELPLKFGLSRIANKRNAARKRLAKKAPD